MLASTAILLFLEFVIMALVSGNNLSVCSGTIIGSRMTTRRNGVLLAVLGYAAGFLLEGKLLRRGIYAVMPVRSTELIILALSIAIVIFIIAHKKRVPQSLSVNFISILLGISVALGFRVDWTFTIFIIAFWILAPLLSVLVMIPAMRKASGAATGWHIWKAVGRIKLALFMLSFFTAFTLGANTLGFLYSALPDGASLLAIVVALAAMLFGGVFLSGAELNRIGSEIISMRYLNSVVSQSLSAFFVELATIVGIPLSNTQTFTASIYGAGLSYKGRLMSRSPAISIVFTWVLGALLSFALAFFISLLLL